MGSLAVASESGQGKIALANGETQLAMLKSAEESLQIAKQDITMKAEFSNGTAQATIAQGESDAQETELNAEQQKMSAFTNAAVEASAQGMGMKEGAKADSFSKQEDFGQKALTHVQTPIKPAKVDLKKNIGNISPALPKSAEKILKGEKNALARPYQTDDPDSRFNKFKSVFKMGSKNPNEQQELDALREDYLKLSPEQQTEFKDKLKAGAKKAGKTADKHSRSREGHITAANRYQNMANSITGWQYGDQIAAQKVKTANERANQDQWSQIASNDHSYDQATQQFSGQLQVMRELATVERTAGEQNQVRG